MLGIVTRLTQFFSGFIFRRIQRKFWCCESERQFYEEVAIRPLASLVGTKPQWLASQFKRCRSIAARGALGCK